MAQAAYATDAVAVLPITGLNGPNSVAVDSSGNIFVADSLNSTVKEFLASENYATPHPIGSGFSDPNGIAIDASGNVFVADSANNAVKEFMPSDEYTQPKILGHGFVQPYGVAVDASGNVFVADYGNLAVEEILSAGDYSTVVPLGGGYSFGSIRPDGTRSGPTGVAVDSAGNVFVADYGDYQVEEIIASGNYQMVKILSGAFKEPNNVALDSHGNVFVADIYGSSVGEILADGGYATVLTLSGGFAKPSGVALDPQGDVIVSDSSANTISRIMTQGANFGSVPVGMTSQTNLALSFTLSPLQPTSLAAPSVFTLGAGSQDFQDAGDTCPPGTYNGGTVCTVNVSFTPQSSGTRLGAIALKDSSGNLLATSYIYGTGTAPQIAFAPATSSTLPTGTINPSSVAADGSGNIFYADSSANTVTERLASEGYATPHPVGSGFNAPTSIALDGEGNLFVADTGNNAVEEVLATGGYTNVASVGSGFTSPFGVAVSGGGNVFVLDSSNTPVKKVPFLGGYVSTYPLGTGFTNPSSIAVDADGNVFVADAGTLKEVARTGGYSNVTPLTSGLASSSKIALDGNNNIFVTDTTSTVVKEFLAAGGYLSVSTVGGDFNGPSGLFVDASGNVLVADEGNHAIKKLDTVTPPTLNFPDTAYGSTSSKTLTITNAGNQPLTFPVLVSGSNPAISDQFSIDSTSTCPISSSTSGSTTLAAGTSCTELISFTPTQVGATSGKLTLVDDTLNAPAPNYATQIVVLNGNATTATPTISFSVPNQTFGNPPFTVAATSNSTGAFTYSVVSGPAQISGNTVTLTGAGSVTLLASQAATAQYSAGSTTATFLVATATPAITFSVANQAFGAPPFMVAATSNSPGAFTYSVVSGPAIVTGNTVTLTGTGSVTLSASQAATPNFSAASTTATFLVTLGFTVTATPPSATVVPAGSVDFALSVAPGNGTTFPHAIELTASGLPHGATATFSPAEVPAGSGSTQVKMTIQTTIQVAREQDPQKAPLSPIAFGILLFPGLLFKRSRRAMRKMPHLLLLATLSLTALLATSGCGSGLQSRNQNFPIVITATDTVSGDSAKTTVNLHVQ